MCFVGRSIGNEFEPLLQGESAMESSLLSEFRLDWFLAGKAERIVDNYLASLRNFVSLHPSPELSDARAWVVYRLLIPSEANANGRQ